MRRIVSTLVAAAALAGAAGPASAATLIDVTNLPQEFNISQSLTFTATSASTTIAFQGYQLPGSIALVNIFLAATGTAPSDSSNLLGTNFTATSSACAAPIHATIAEVGDFGANNIDFGGGCVGLYDSLSQTVSTTAGASYTLQFVFSNIGVGPNGLRITANEAAVLGAVPEPATWAMMLLGFGAIGFAVRRQRKQRGLMPSA